MNHEKDRTLLLVGCDFNGLLDIVHEGIIKYSGYKSECFNFYSHQRSFYYRNFSHRATNFLLKNTTGLNLKEQHFDLSVTEAILNLKPEYDIILIQRPELLKDHHLYLLRQKTRQFMAIYWDSVERFPRKLKITHFFDNIYSYDPENCRQHGFTLLPHFHFQALKKTSTKYDVYGLSYYDNRFPAIEKISAYFKNIGLNCLIKAHSGKPFISNLVAHTAIIPYRKMLEEVQHANAILDVQQPLQTGLSFRPFESIGFQKKLITTNPFVKNYDFYNPNNICIIDTKNPSIDPDFFNSPYEPLPESIRKKYHLKNWIDCLLPMAQNLKTEKQADPAPLYRSLHHPTPILKKNKLAG